ncbi:MAG: hypothetical protein MUO76_22700, partial [Anaerolineaceae bacterium]|nr:hypothetical protein [Anaerolineaceae bacterium]
TSSDFGFRPLRKSGRFAPELVDDIRRNQWTITAGIGGRFPPDYALNTQVFLDPSCQCSPIIPKIIVSKG